MRYFESELTDELLKTLISMSGDWEAENSCHGYCRNGREYIEGNRIFLAAKGDVIVGYLFGQVQKSEHTTSIMPAETDYFEIEELYVVPQHRNQGIGRALFAFAEKTVKSEGLQYIMLSTATKNYKSILRFYIEEMEMEFWSARLFKKL